MTESLITISIVGLIAGFIFSMPIAGPISILVTSNALKGRLRYCNMATLGASFADFVYVFAAVFGLTNFYTEVKPFFPYILVIGAIFLLYLGIKIARTKVDIEHIDESPAAQHESHMAERIKKQHRGGFWTGFMLNFLNPTLFLGWLTSSFVIISLVSSLGFDVGGLDKTIKSSYTSIHKMEGDTSTVSKKTLFHMRLDSVKRRVHQHQPTEEEIAAYPKYFPVLLSGSYAFFLSVGSIVWFFFLAFILARHRSRINVNVINNIIRSLGVFLCFFGVLLAYKAWHMF